MAEFDAQADRAVSAEAELSSQQVVADEVDLADSMRGLAEMVAAGKSLDDSLAEVAEFAAHAIPGLTVRG